MAKIMIVDDETELLELVSITLEQKGHEVLTADRGENALEMIKDKRPDLILLDINMPVLNGWETLEEMEWRGIIDEIPVVMFTIEELVLENMLRNEINHVVDYIETFRQVRTVGKSREDRRADQTDRENKEANRKCRKRRGKYG